MELLDPLSVADWSLPEQAAPLLLGKILFLAVLGKALVQESSALGEI